MPFSIHRTHLTAAAIAVSLAGAVAPPASAQIYERTIGTNLEERAEWNVATSDGGSIIVGLARNPDRIIVVKLDANGNTQWKRHLFGFATEIGNRILETQDGGYAIAGETSNGLGFGISLIKLDGAGNLLWARAYPGIAFAGGAGGGTAFDENADGGFIVVGRTQNASAQQAPVIFRTDSIGGIIWHKFLIDGLYGPNTYGSFHDVHPVEDAAGTEGFIATGWLTSGVTGSRDTLVVRFDGAGAWVWANTYSIPNFTDMGYGIDPLADGDFAVCGYTKAVGEGGGSYVMRIDGGGGLQWWNNYGTFQATNALEETSTGDLVLGGSARDFVTVDGAAMMHLDALGNVNWAHTYGGTNQEFGESVTLFPNGYQLAAWTNSAGAGDFDMYAVRTDLFGKTGCEEPFTPPVTPDEPLVEARDFIIINEPEAISYELEPTVPPCENVVVCADDPDCVLPPDCMVMWLPLDEPVGPVTTELIYNAPSSHANGPTPLIGAYVDNARCYDEAADQYTRVLNLPAHNFGTGDFSMDAWIRTTDSTGVATIIDKRDDFGGVQGYHMFLVNGRLGFQLADGSGSNLCACTVTAACTNYVSTTFVADGNWHLVAVTVDRDSPTGGTFFVDGVAVGTFDPTCRPGSVSNTADLRLAGESYIDNQNYTGCIDEVELFGRVLTAAEVNSLFAAGTGGKCKDLCLADFDGDGVVGFSDLIAVLSGWGPCSGCCPLDLNGDGVVGFADLLQVLAAWGPCP